ncbi:SCO family protein [Thiolapillus sp.]|uniref:SCO family protein n=1 Tax=Thiolapillus sp. TaxID=2017437 RepID=UPI0025DA95F5
MKLRQKKIAPKLLFALFAVLIFIASYYLGNQYARPLVKDISATVLPRPEKIGGFVLTDKDGKVFTADSFKNFWNFVVVGNLYDGGCDSLLRLSVSAWNRLAANPALQKTTRIVFVQAAAGPDGTEKLKQAIEFYNPAFTAVSGDKREIQKLGQQIGLYTDNPGCNPESSVVALINPEGYLLALFTGSDNPAEIARDLQYFN